MRRPNKYTILVLAIAAFGFFAIWAPRYGIPGVIVLVLALAGLIVYERFNVSHRSREWLRRASQNPLVLHPPFDDRWYVAAGGPDPRHNHHTVVTDQYFAYDFLREDAPSWDSLIVAPCAGMVVHVENRQEDAPVNEGRRERARPFGNYVSIQHGRGYVVLAHLKKGSVVVRVGDTVEIGDPIGRCGNSGNTRGPHLHVHAQDQPSQSIDTARGIPIAFVDRLRSEPMLLEYGDKLG